MRITDLDPLEHGLIFERFLNPERVSMPDFDVDFDDRRRGEVIQYVTEKYGDERVAQIVTYGTIKAKQALKDAGRVLGFPFSMGERLTKAMPPAVMGKDMPLEGMFDPKHPRYKEAVRVPRADRDGCRGQDRLRHGSGPREPEAPVGRARRRRDHVERAADRHHPDHEARAGRPDRHAVRLSRRASRSASSRWTSWGCATSRSSTTRSTTSRPNRGEKLDARRPRARRPGVLRPARARRHARRLPARRRPDALAPAAYEARQLRGHLRRARAVPPGSDGRRLAHQLRAAQERPAGDHARSTPSSKSRCATSSAARTA